MRRKDLTILVDMDGVLTNFEKAVAEISPAPYSTDNTDYHKLYETMGWDNEQNMWDAVLTAGEGFWANMEPLPWARQLWNLVTSTNCKVLICTSPARTPDCLSGKYKWMQKFFDKSSFYDFIITPRKWACAKPTSFLIDDREDKFEDFLCKGGNGCLFPTKWNSGRSFAEEGPALTHVEVGLHNWLCRMGIYS